MGTWFPGFRTAIPEQCREYRDAQRAQFRNADYEHAANDRKPSEPSAWYDRYNTRTHDAAQPLSRVQQWWHFQRTLTEYDREATRLQRASDRQDRQQRRTRRAR